MSEGANNDLKPGSLEELEKVNELVGEPPLLTEDERFQRDIRIDQDRIKIMKADQIVKTSLKGTGRLTPPSQK